MYYVFNETLASQIGTAIQNAKGGGFFDFKPHQKTVEITNVPNSNTDLTPIRIYRTVIILETTFAPEDALLQNEAEASAEIFSDDPQTIHEYLNSPDI